MVLRPLALLAVPLLFVVALQVREQTICGGGQPISPTVVSTYCGHRQDGNEVVDLLVLWRGAPGWFNRAGGRGKGAGSSGNSAYQYAQFGDVSIGIELNGEARTAKVHDEVVSLESSNVVLVDGVDEPDHGHIVGTRWIEPTYPADGDPLLLTLQRQTELADYLRCDLAMPEPPAPAPMRRLRNEPDVCTQLRRR